MKKNLRITLVISLLVLLTVVIIALSGGSVKKNPGGNYEKQNSTSQSDGYEFTYNGTKIKPGEEIAKVLNALGAPDKQYETNSCAYQGMEGVYTYRSFEIYTYNDAVIRIVLLDDLAETGEGVFIGNKRSVVEEKYGSPDKTTETSYIYEKGSTTLFFIFDADKVISIQYETRAE